jgi:DNA-binding LacI/PurR family transcriptional regulator
MAQKAIDLLVAQLNGERISPETTLPVTLIPGDTV